LTDNYTARAFDGNVLDRRSMDDGSVSGGVTGGVARGVAETVTVEAASPRIDERAARDAQRQMSQNVVNLQRRAAGVLPIHVEVPRAGTSHQFVKPLVVDQEATVTLRYKRRR
jgi:hypothetical protein